MKKKWLLVGLMIMSPGFVFGKMFMDPPAEEPAAPPVSAAPSAHADLINAQGEPIGTAQFSTEEGGVTLSLNVQGLTPGLHGFHIHENGVCLAPDFASAGGHFNPTGKHHGLKNPEGAHVGDLPNLSVGDDGKGSVEAVIRGATFGEGADSLFKTGGTAVVIHASADDEVSDPAGNAGARVACGVVVRD